MNFAPICNKKPALICNLTLPQFVINLHSEKALALLLGELAFYLEVISTKFHFQNRPRLLMKSLKLIEFDSFSEKPRI